MTVPRPDAVVTVDGQSWRARVGGLGAVHVELGIAGCLDAVTLVASGHGPVVDAVPGADLTVSVDAGDGTDALVFTGTVTDVRHTSWGAVVQGLTEAVVLASARIGRAYLAQTAGDVASDLISSGGARPGTVDAPLDLPVYLASDRRTVWRNLQDLARLSGSMLRSQPDGTVDFAPVRTGSADHRLRMGADLLAWSAGPAGALAPAAAVVPAGAASEAGSSRWQFLLAEPDGGPSDEPTIVPVAVRSRDAAQVVEAALVAATARRELAGTVVAIGAAAVRAGDLVELVDVPRSPDRPWRAVEVHHVLDRAGLRSRIRLEAA